MSEPLTTPSPSASRASSRVPFILATGVCLVTALSVILWAQTRPPRAVKVALVTWNNDPFWDPVIRGAEDAAREWNLQLTTVRSTPEVETQSKHVRDLL